MKFKIIAAASLLALGTGTASAYTTSFSWDAATSTFEFGARGIASGASGTDTFVIDGISTTLAPGLYEYEADISGSKLRFVSVTIGPDSFTLATPRVGVAAGTVAVATTVVVDWSANTFSTPQTAANYQGSVILTPIPEPGSLALMLAGISALAFMVRRRSA